MGRRRLHWPVWALVAALGVASTGRADPIADTLKLTPVVDGVTPVTLWASNVFTWSENGETVYALSGKVVVRQDQTELKAERAIVWIEEKPQRLKKPTRVVVFAEKLDDAKVTIDSRGQPTLGVDRAVLEFTTPSIGWVRGQEQQKSLADSPIYQRAMAARGKPLPDGIVPAGFVQEPKTPETTGPDGTPLPVSPKGVSGLTELPVPLKDEKQIQVVPRTNRPFAIASIPGKNKDEATYIITGGVKVIARFATGELKTIEIEADQVVVWNKGKNTGAFDAMVSPEGTTQTDGIELYLSGNVIMRYGPREGKDDSGKPQQIQSRTLRAERVWYDMKNNKSIAVGADLEYTREGFRNTGHVMAEEIHQLSSSEFTAYEAMIHASRLPSDPGLRMRIKRADIYRMPRDQRRTIFGLPFRDRETGEIVEEDPDILEAESLSVLVGDSPIFYLPRVKAKINDPFGPFEGVTFRQDRIFGFQAYATWDMLELIGLTPLKGENWTLLTDYLSNRGPALGTNYTRNSPTMMGMDAPYKTLVKGYAIRDKGEDVLGGPRQDDFVPPAYRSRFLFRHEQQFTLMEPYDLTLQSQVAYLSDRNFLEQYYGLEQRFGPNQETFAWLKYQTGNFAGTFLFEPDLGRDWVTETYWLPRVDGHLIGQSLFERMTYHTWASAAYARLDPFRSPAREYPFGVDNGLPPREAQVNTGRLDWMHVLGMPLDAGPVRLVPYGVLDTAFYTENNTGDQQGRLYGGYGLKATVPLSKLYRDVESELFNVNGLYHKNQFGLNYYHAGSTASYLALPQLDRLNDDATEQSYRDVTPYQPEFTNLKEANGDALGFGAFNKFNPRLYAIRRLIDTKPDTLDDIHVAQVDWRQRLQTKRGYPGLEHTVDWLVLDTSASIFPQADRDNFGSAVGFLEYRLLWNVGDATSFYSSGWVDPFEFGARYYEIGTYFARDDRTQFNISYRSVDPIQSRVVTAAATYVFSPKYAGQFVTSYDFGSQASLTNQLLFSRLGTDVQVTFGFTYNSILNNFGVQFNVVPNLLANQNSPVPGNRRNNQAAGGGATGSGR